MCVTPIWMMEIYFYTPPRISLSMTTSNPWNVTLWHGNKIQFVALYLKNNWKIIKSFVSKSNFDYSHMDVLRKICLYRETSKKILFGCRRCFYAKQKYSYSIILGGRDARFFFVFSISLIIYLEIFIQCLL